MRGRSVTAFADVSRISGSIHFDHKPTTEAYQPLTVKGAVAINLGRLELYWDSSSGGSLIVISFKDCSPNRSLSLIVFESTPLFLAKTQVA